MADTSGPPSDAELIARTHPTDWRNPVAAGRYNLVVVGAGTAGLVCAAGAAGLGARVALVEKHRLGGDCLHTGCVPSKALLRCARAAAEARRAADFGVRLPGPVAVDFPAVMARLRRLRADISRNDAAERFRALGVDVFLGAARFTGPDAVEVGGQALRFARAVVATGSRPAVPDVPGLEEIGYLTNETVFDLEELPRRLIVIGGGPIGCELSQAFARLGSEVHLVHRGERLLPRDEPEAAELLQERLRREGVALHLGCRPTAAGRVGGEARVIVEGAGGTVRLAADAVLVVAGRRANVEGLGLERAGVACGADGVKVDDFLRTSNRRVYAAGDVCSALRFTHAADAQARVVVRNALFFDRLPAGRARASRLVIPWCTYTDPEIAHVGLTTRQAAAQGVAVQTFRRELADVDRAVLDGEAEGFALVHVRKGGDRIVGATVVASHAGEMIGEVVLALSRRLGLSALGQTVRPYPTQAEALRGLGDAYQRSRLTPGVAAALRAVLRWLR